MKTTHINLWYSNQDGERRCFETVPAFVTDDEEILLSARIARELLGYEWPANRWAVSYDAVVAERVRLVQVAADDDPDAASVKARWG